MFSNPEETLHLPTISSHDIRSLYGSIGLWSCRLWYLVVVWLGIDDLEAAVAFIFTVTSQYYNPDENITTFQTLSISLCLGQITWVFGFIEELSRAKNKKNNKPQLWPLALCWKEQRPWQSSSSNCCLERNFRDFLVLSTATAFLMMEGTAHLDRDTEIVLKNDSIYGSYEKNTRTCTAS